MINKLNKNIEEFIKILTKDLNDEWGDGGLGGVQLNMFSTRENKPKGYFELFTFMGERHFIVEAIEMIAPKNNRGITLSIMKVLPAEVEINGIKEQWWDLHIRDMSQNPDDPVPALLIRAKEFNIYEIETEKDEEGNIKDRPSLADFIKWKEEQEESKEMVNK